MSEANFLVSKNFWGPQGPEILVLYIEHFIILKSDTAMISLYINILERLDIFRFNGGILRHA